MARSSSVMHFAFVNSLDGSSFGLSCWFDSTATVDRLSGSAAVECRNPRPHNLMRSVVYDSFPPVWSHRFAGAKRERDWQLNHSAMAKTWEMHRIDRKSIFPNPRKKVTSEST